MQFITLKMQIGSALGYTNRRQGIEHMARRISKIPQSLIFICEKKRLVALDSSALDDFLQGVTEPWLELNVGSGPDDIFEERPIKVIERTKNEISIVTTGYTVRVELSTGAAFKIMPDGSQFEFRGGVKRADPRRGWIPLSRG